MSLEDLPIISNPLFPKRARELALIKKRDERKPLMYYVAAKQIVNQEERLITTTSPEFRDEKFLIYEKNVIAIPVKNIERYETKTIFP
jgi:hypothetical protein